MSYDYLPDLPPEERAAARRLTFTPYTLTQGTEWDYVASYDSSSPGELLRDDFLVTFQAGATYDIISRSFFDPYILRVHDGDGNVIAIDQGAGDYGTDYIWNFVAPYTGDYYVSASWHQGQYHPGVHLALYEDRDTISSVPPTTPTTSVTATVGDDILYGTSGDDVINAIGGNDIIRPDAGNDTVDGGSGFDMVVFSGNYSGYTVSRQNGRTVISGADGTDTVVNVERLIFADRAMLGNAPSWQPQNSGFVSANLGNRTVAQEAISLIEDPSRGVLSTRITVGGQEVQGVPSTLRQGWKLAALTDVDGDGADEIFFFGVENVSGVGQGYGATWEMGSDAVTVTDSRVQFQMSRTGWEVAGAAELNQRGGSEIIWQHTTDGTKAIWSDTDGDGTVDYGGVIGGLSALTTERIVGVSDINGNGAKELIVYDDSTYRFTLFELAVDSLGGVSGTAITQTALYSDVAAQPNVTMFGIGV